jgi:hypothetical protein
MARKDRPCWTSGICDISSAWSKPVESSRSSFDFAAFAQPAGFRDGVSAGRSAVVTKRRWRQADGRRSEALPPRPDVLRQMQEMEVDVVSEGGGAVGQVAVGLPTSIAAVLAVPFVERLALDHLRIRLQLFESLSGYLVELLCNGRLDMAILFRDAESSGVAIRPLFSEYLSVFGAPGVGDPEASTCDLSLLSGVPLVLPGLSNWPAVVGRARLFTVER